jgi:adenylosuccinate lyase
VTERIPPAELEKLFDLDHHLRHVDHIFTRVFGPNVSE